MALPLSKLTFYLQGTPARLVDIEDYNQAWGLARRTRIKGLNSKLFELNILRNMRSSTH